MDRYIKYIIITFLGILAICSIVLTIYILQNKENDTFIKYSEYDYLKDKINEYNDVYSLNSGNGSTNILLLEDEKNVILMITNPKTNGKGEDVALIDFTNMKIQNTSYNEYGSATMITTMTIDEDYTITSASTYLYSADRYKTYSQYDTEWKQIQLMAWGIGNGTDTIIKGNNGYGINIFKKTIQELKNTEYN